MSSLSLDDSSILPEDFIVLVSMSKTRFELTRKECSLSKLIQTSLSDDLRSTHIPVSDRFSDIEIEKMVEFLKHHNGESPIIPEQPLRSKHMKEVTSEWCAIYIDEIGCKRDLLYKMIDIANYFDIHSLLYIACAKVASLIKGQKLEDIKTILMENETK